MPDAYSEMKVSHKVEMQMQSFRTQYPSVVHLQSSDLKLNLNCTCVALQSLRFNSSLATTLFL